MEAAEDIWSEYKSTGRDCEFYDEALDQIMFLEMATFFLHYFFEDELWARFFAKWRRSHRLPSSVKVLHAHGESDLQGDWVYFDGHDSAGRKVEDWVRENDGHHTVLATASCNENTKLVLPTKSLLIISNVVISQYSRPEAFSVVTPEGVQDSATLEWNLDHWHRRRTSRPK